MSETEPIAPTSSVTTLRIPTIKKGEYDLWSMKMRQTSLAANARRNNKKALNILLSAIPDRHLLSFHDAKVKGSTLKQSTAEATTIPKGISTTASSKGAHTFKLCFSLNEIICSFFSQQASMPTTHDDEDLLQIDEDAMEEIDIRWQLGHFARECRFAKYQENRANGRQEKKTVAIEDSNSKALVATDNNEDIDWTKEFDAEPTTFAMMALTEVEQDDWSMYLRVGSPAVLPQNKSAKKSAMITSKQTWRRKGNYLDSVNRDNKKISRIMLLLTCALEVMTGDKDKLSDFQAFKGGYVAFGNDSKGGRISIEKGQSRHHA
ncbi:hypothetical protein Tco_0797398 [Tanacetum coccineum]